VQVVIAYPALPRSVTPPSPPAPTPEGFAGRSQPIFPMHASLERELFPLIPNLDSRAHARIHTHNHTRTQNKTRTHTHATGGKAGVCFVPYFKGDKTLGLSHCMVCLHVCVCVRVCWEPCRRMGLDFWRREVISKQLNQGQRVA
jgi:hypothetical protein